MMRLQHVSIAIPVGGEEQARAFYGGLLGLSEVQVLPKLDPARFVWFGLGGDVELHLMLFDDVRPQQSHFCVAIESGLDELRARLDAAGVTTRDGTEVVGRPRFTCRDPFGNYVEVAELSAPVTIS
ncbi:MAG TPA: VOC family protein [Gaiellaceae bacterium]|jgi:catechol 2,3-dioxygenase-like lactoylglutathione lyase family enzyme